MAQQYAVNVDECSSKRCSNAMKSSSKRCTNALINAPATAQYFFSIFFTFFLHFPPPQCSVRHNALRSRQLVARLYSLHVCTYTHACIHTYVLYIYIYIHTHTHGGGVAILSSCVLSWCRHTHTRPSFFFPLKGVILNTHTHTHTYNHARTHTLTLKFKGWSLTRWSPPR
jgi:hypothetical protein